MVRDKHRPLVAIETLKLWQFWVICIATLGYFIDIFLQWLLFGAVVESIMSIALFGLLGYEVYLRLRYKKSYLGEKFAVVIAFFSLLMLAFIYII